MTGSFNTLLIAVDFSAPSREAFRQALNLLAGDAPVMIVLHVIDQDLLELMSSSELGDGQDLLAKLRRRREDDLRQFTELAGGGFEIQGVVSVGIPFLEIIRKAQDFAVDAIVMGKVGAGNRFDKLLFGSTAERVLRGSVRPVIVFPSPASPAQPE
jgi:nucleotide-binding universal stress UspA family protein